MSRLGNHRLRPARSLAAKAKPRIQQLERQIAEAKRRGQGDTVDKLEREHAWAVMNSMR